MTEQNWLNDDQLAIAIWNNKYRYNNETLDEWFNRVSNNNEQVKNIIIQKKFLFGGRILASRGVTDKKVTYSNCYVLDIKDDSIESIFETGSKIARTFSYGGGVGIDISKLRPRGAAVNNAAKQTTGAVSFMDFYSHITGLIGQNNRRGALMISIDCNHPDIEEFISIKSDLDKVTKANISVKVTDEFMNAVIKDLPYKLEFILENGNSITKEVQAKKIFRKLAEMNWDYAEPGILYWDTIEQHNLLNTNPNFKYAGVNP